MLVGRWRLQQSSKQLKIAQRKTPYQMKISELIVLPRKIDAQGQVVYRSQIVMPGVGKHVFSFRFPQEHDDPRIGQHNNYHLLAMLMPAMRVGGKLRVHGSLDQQLVNSLDRFQHYWVRWCPDRFRMLDIEADEWIAPQKVEPPAAISCFSGGVDAMHSFLTLEKNTGIPVKSLLFLHGYDLDLSRRDYYDQLADPYDEWLQTQAVPLIRLEANARETAHQFQLNWGSMAHGVFLAAGMHLFSHAHSHGCISSSDTASTLIYPWGSNPVTDPLMSSSTMEVMHYDCRFSKFEKILELVRRPEVCGLLRVCYRQDHQSANCGRCGKCLRTLIKMHVAKKDSWKQAFPMISDIQEAFAKVEDTEFSYCILQQLSYAREHAMRCAEPHIAQALDSLVHRISQQLAPFQTRFRRWFYDGKVRLYAKYPSLIKKTKQK